MAEPRLVYIHYFSGVNLVEILGLILMGIGGLGAILCGLWLLILQFQSSILWGLACLIVPFASLIWLAIYWDDGKHPFLYSVLCVAVMFGGAMMSGNSLA